MKKQRWLGVLISVIVGGGLGAVIGYLQASNVETETTFWRLIGTLLSLTLSFLLHVCIHELGHLCFGKLSGYQFSSIRFGSFILLHQDGKLQWKRYTLAGTGGQCLMVPPSPYSPSMPILLYNLGGSLANLLLSAVSVGCFLLSEQTTFLVFSLVGVALALMNGIPMRLGLVANDGYNAFYLRKNEAAVYSFWAQLQMNAAQTKGIRLKDMPLEWFELPEQAHWDDSLCAAIGVFSCSRFMDELNFEAAKKQIDCLLEHATGLLGVHRMFLTVDRVYCALLEGTDLQELQAWFTPEFRHFLKKERKNISVLRMNYAYALLAKYNPEEAAQKRLEFDRIARSYPYSAVVENERELLDLADQCVQAQAEKQGVSRGKQK